MMIDFKKLNPKEKNTQKKDIFLSYRSNSYNHYKDISNHNYEHRIRLKPEGEDKSMDIRENFPISLIQNYYIKSNTMFQKNKNHTCKNAYESADIQNRIFYQTNKQKEQMFLENEKIINRTCKNKTQEIKESLDKKKLKLKEELTTIIKDALKFGKKNSAVRAMLPDNINEIVEKAKKETQDLSLNLNVSHISKISRVSSIGMKTGIQKADFLQLLGVDVENLNISNVNIDIDKCWNYILKLAKGRKVEDILRYKVVNEIMNITEKKSAEKAKKIYEKLAIYKKYMENKRREEMLRKKREKEQKEQEAISSKDFIKKKIKKSLSQPRLLSPEAKSEQKFSFMKGSSTKKLRKSIQFTKKDKKEKQKKSDGERSSLKNAFRKKNLIRLDAYNDVNKIIDFIDNSKKNSQSFLFKNHFSNIQMAKSINSSMRIRYNNDIICK